MPNKPPIDTAIGTGTKAGAAGKKRMPFAKKRAITTFVVFASMFVGLIVCNGWGTLCSFGLDAVAYICPLGALETLLAEHTIIPRALLSLACIVLAAVLLGRTFCAWVCPIPPIGRFFHPEKKNAEAAAPNKTDASDTTAATVKTDTAGKTTGPEVTVALDAAATISETTAVAETASVTGASVADTPTFPVAEGTKAGPDTGHALPPVGGERTGVRFDSRHGVLLGGLVSTAIFGFPVFCLICPIGLTLATVVCLFRTFVEHDPTLSLLIFPAILLVEIVFFRKWCHKICPVGALLSLLGAKSGIARPRVDTRRCLRSKGVNCLSCTHACPELLDPHVLKIPECTRCGACADVCPQHAITMHKVPEAQADEQAE
jgi:ferredoxin-type protein NapH